MSYNFPIQTYQPVQIPEYEEQMEQASRAIQEGRREIIEQAVEMLAKAIKSTPDIFDEVVGALSSLCANPTYNSTAMEDSMNDYVRDILGHGMQVRDQTRQGLSGNSRSAEKGQAGELDIQIRNNGRPIGIYEGLRLNSVDSKAIDEHIEKATVKYNPQGVKETFIVAYVWGHSTGFGDFWKRFMDCVKRYHADEPEHQIIWDDNEEDTGLSAVRSIHGVYNMDDVPHNVHVMAVKLMR